jgi:predicted acylesterase/phospholipase RssA
MDNDNSWKPQVLVIGPGGIKGLKALGFLSPLEDSGLIDQIDTFCGVSIGSVICLLLLIGYKVREIVGGAITFDIFKDFEDIKNLNLTEMIQNRGLISNEPARKHLTKLVIDKLGIVPNLKNLYLMTGKSFISVALNATDDMCQIMDMNNNPDLSCINAVLFSMNIPYMFYQIIYKSKIYVDGALANPYPVDYFDDGRTNILGIYMTNKSKNNDNDTNNTDNSIIREIIDKPLNFQMNDILLLCGYFNKIFNSLINQRRNDILQKTSKCCRHIKLECKSDDITGHTLSIEEKSIMLVEGYNEGKVFLSDIKNNTFTNFVIHEKLSYKYPKNFTNSNANNSTNISDDI